ncbi:hypothetical protein ACJBCE_37005 [Streptomyces sp. NBUL23]|uniref:hypothetical protein n=1 Tax=Streptomyces sp. NBUL23 TaxID=3381354 RepID=UPI003871CB49
MPTNTTINALLAAPDASPVPVAAVVAVAHALDVDRRTLSLGLMPDAYTGAITLESREEDSDWTYGPLRYCVDHDTLDVLRLCTNPTCDQISISPEHPLTRVCTRHIDTLIPGLLPTAGDDIREGDAAEAAQESRARRLDAWQSVITGARAELDGDQRVLDSLRAPAETSA